MSIISKPQPRTRIDPYHGNEQETWLKVCVGMAVAVVSVFG
jgi:hypothetical protein